MDKLASADSIATVEQQLRETAHPELAAAPVYPVIRLYDMIASPWLAHRRGYRCAHCDKAINRGNVFYTVQPAGRNVAYWSWDVHNGCVHEFLERREQARQIREKLTQAVRP